MQENYHEFLRYCEKQISKQTNNKYLEGLDDIKNTKQRMLLCVMQQILITPLFNQ